MHVSKVYKICMAYESGFGHGLDGDGKTGDYFTDTDLNEAYKIGYSEGNKIIIETDNKNEI